MRDSLPDSLARTVLATGPNPSGGPRCFMETVAWYAGEPHSDAPRCASPLLAAYANLVNDWLPDSDRQSLRMLVPLVARTGPERETDHAVREEHRKYALADYCARRFVPVLLLRASLGAHIPPFQAVPVIHSASSAHRFLTALEDEAAKISDGRAAGVLRWMAKGLDPLLTAKGVHPDVALYTFEPLSLSAADDATRSLASQAMRDCLHALVAPARTRRGWVDRLQESAA